MAEKIKTQLIVVWEHEIREAAAAVAEFYAEYGKPCHEAGAPEDAEATARLTSLGGVAISLCGRALHGITDEAALVLTSLPIKRRRRARGEVA